jgi:hypothetical protein
MRQEFGFGVIPGLVQSRLRKTNNQSLYLWSSSGGEYTQSFGVSGLAIRRRPGVVFRMEHSIGGPMGSSYHFLACPVKIKAPSNSADENANPIRTNSSLLVFWRWSFENISKD